MGGWPIQAYLAMPAEYKPVLVKLVEEQNREVEKARTRGR